MKTKKFVIPLTENDVLDIKLTIQKNQIIGFALNFRSRISEVWYAIYRVDTAHGYLHEQRFWINPEPIHLPRFEGMSIKYLFNFFIDEIKKNWKRYRNYYEEKMKFR